MKFYVGDKVYDFYDEEELDSYYLDEGQEGICYKINDNEEDLVFKIYKNDCSKVRLCEEDCNKLKSISTKRILMPKDLIYDEKEKYVGYTTKFIESEKVSKNLKMENFMDSLNMLKNDCEVLSDYGIDIEDLNVLNTIYSNGIYLCDPGSYMVVKDESSKRFLRYLNRDTLNVYEIESVLFKLFKFNKKEREIIRNRLLNDSDYITDVLDLIGYNKDEDVKSFFKSFAR